MGDKILLIPKHLHVDIDVAWSDLDTGAIKHE